MNDPPEHTMLSTQLSLDDKPEANKFANVVGSLVETEGKTSLREQAKSNKVFAEEESVIKVKDFYLALKYIQTRRVLWRLCVHLAYTVLFAYIVIDLFNPGQIYAQTFALSDIFLDEEFPASNNSDPFFKKNFFQVGTFDEYWEWVQGPVVNAVFNNRFFDGTSYPPNSTSQFVVPNGFGGNRIVSSIRFRTQRVRPNDSAACKSLDPEVFRDLAEGFPECYPPFSGAVMDSAPWNGFPFVDGLSGVRGIIGYASTPIEDYGRSGYVYYLPLFSDLHGTVPYTPDEARAIIQRDLVQQRWTDEATRLLVIDFNVLNLNLGNAMTVRFVFEVMPGGGMFNYWRMYPIVVNPLSRAGDYARLILQCVYAGMSVFFLCEFLYVSWKRRVMSLWLGWDLIKLSIPVVMILLIFIAELTYFNADYLAQFISSMHEEPNGFYDAFEDGRLLNYISTFSCLNLIIHMIQIFKLLSWSSLFTLVFSALVEAFPELVALFLTFFTFTTVAAVTGHILFGPWTDDFHSLFNSYSTLFQVLIGDVNYERIYAVEPNFAGVYFAIVIFVNVFVLLNMFIAVMSSFYDLTKRRKQRMLAVFQDRDSNLILCKSGFELFVSKVKLETKALFFYCCISRREKKMQQKKYEPSNSFMHTAMSSSSRTVSDTVGHLGTINAGSATKLTSKNGLSSLMKSRPSNWQGGKISPDVIRRDMENWMSKPLEERVRLSRLSGGKKNPYRKLWFWAVHKIATQYHIYKIETRRCNPELDIKRQQEVKKQVETSRRVLDRIYGSESSFRRNWFAIKGVSPGIKNYLQFEKLRFTHEQNQIRYKIYKILGRGISRQRQRHIELFEMYNKAWLRMSHKEKTKGFLLVKDLAEILGHDDIDDPETVQEVKRLLQYVSDLHEPKPTYALNVHLEEEKTAIDDIKDEVREVSRVLHNLQSSIAKTQHTHSVLG